jgi:cellulose synthase A
LRSYRAALERHFGNSPAFIASAFASQERGGDTSAAADASCLLREAIHVVSCAYEARTRWGKDVGWMYGSGGGGGGVVTGFRMHARGWSSAYCAPARTAFRSFARASPADVLASASKRAVAAMGVLLSRHCPVWAGAGGSLRFMQRLGYVSCVAYPLASIPLTVYCALPAACLLTGKSIFPDDVGFNDAVVVILLLSSVVATVALELRWSGVTLRAWWRDQKLWAVTGTSACLAAVFQGILRSCAGVDVCFSSTYTETAATRTSSSTSDDDSGAAGEEPSDAQKSVLRWSNLLIPPASLLLGNLAGVVVAVSYGVDHGYRSWGPVLVKLALALWVVAHLQGFFRGLLARWDRAPTIAVLWSVLFVSVLSLLWVNVDSYSAPPAQSTLQQPVL